MIDIEQRLAGDALRVRRDDPPAPALDMVLDRAVLRSSPQRSVQVWLAVAVVLIGVAGLVTALALRSSDDSAPPAGVSIPLPTPHSISRDGVTYPVGESSPVQVTRDASDPRAVRLDVINAYDSSQPQCSRFDPSARVVRQTSTEVEVVVFDYSVAPLSTQLTCAYRGDKASHRWVSLRLAAPLGNRRVVDARRGLRLALLTRRPAPSPSYVPPKYREFEHTGFDPARHMLPTCTYQNGGATLLLVFLEAAVGSPTGIEPGKAVGHLQVRGQAAVVTIARRTRCLDWSNKAGIFTQICSSGAPRPLPVSELVRVARSLHG